MHGNVLTGVPIGFSDEYYAISESVNPKGPADGSLRVCRGGSWFTTPQDCRSGFRNGVDPSERMPYLGFRVVRNLDDSALSSE